MANPWEVCLKKKKYNTEADALVEGAWQELLAWHPLKAYQCPRCKKWHLTKRDAKGILIPQKEISNEGNISRL